MPKLQLDKRERLELMLAGLALVLVLGLLLYIPMGPRRQYQQSLSEIQGLNNDLMAAQITRQDEEARWAQQQQIIEELERRTKTFELLEFLNRALGERNLLTRADLQSMRPPTLAGQPVETIVMARLQLTGVTLREVLDLLHAVYNSGNLIVVNKMDYLKPASNNEGLDCSITFLTLKTPPPA